MVVCAELALSASTALANKRRDSLHAWMFWHYKHRFGCELSTWTRRYQGCFLRGRRSCSDTVMKRTKTFCRSWKTKKHANPNRSSTTARPDKLTVNLVWCSCWTNAVATEKNDGTKVRETEKVTCFFWSSIRLHGEVLPDLRPRVCLLRKKGYRAPPRRGHELFEGHLIARSFSQAR